MLKATVIATILGFGAVLPRAAHAQTPAPAPDPRATVNQRLENQHDRIHAGVKDDQLTKGEATHLRADDAAIHAEERVYRHANDGKLTQAERRQLNRQLNRNSRQIYRARHNNKG
jgi:hypothetical protein